MAEPFTAPLPLELVIGDGYIVRLTAVDPTTGATVSGVSISDASVFCTHLGGPIEDFAPSPLLVPTDQMV